MADKLQLPHELYTELRRIITNLPEYCISMELRVEPTGFPRLTLECEAHGDDGKPVILKGPLEERDLMKKKYTYRIVSEDDLRDLRGGLERLRSIASGEAANELDFLRESNRLAADLAKQDV